MTSGRQYAVQLWASDNRATFAGIDTVTSTGGNAVTLQKNSTNLGGGVGQYAIGYFTADAATQVFTVSSSGTVNAAQINALQVRDVTNVGY